MKAPRFLTYTHIAALTLIAASIIFSNAHSQLGSLYSQTISAAPGVERPLTPSCEVILLSKSVFDSSIGQFHGKFIPPSTCPAPWAKVVLDLNGQVEHNQIDRLASLWVGGAEIFRGSTPFATGAGAAWHVDKDLSEYSVLLEKPQNVTVQLPNPQGLTNPGVIYLSVTLTFYNTGPVYAEPIHPQEIVPLSASTQGSWFTLDDKNKNATAEAFLPNNIVGATMEVYVTGHGCEEYWYATLLEGCPRSNPFREVQVIVDGQLSGIAWPFPTVYTGSCDPGLWRPIPSINSLDTPPLDVNLTPFASELSNGNKHTITIQVPNNNGYWRVDANLLLYLDQQPLAVGGATTGNTILAQPIAWTRQTVNGLSLAEVSNDSRSFTTSGYTSDARGRIETMVSQKMNFSNSQVMNLVTLAGRVTQSATITTTTTSRTREGNMTETSILVYTIDADCQFMIPQLLPDSYYISSDHIDTITVNGSTTGHGFSSDTLQSQSRRNFYNFLADDQTSESLVTDSPDSCGGSAPCATFLEQSRPNDTLLEIVLVGALVFLAYPSGFRPSRNADLLLTSFLLYLGIVLDFAGVFLLLVKYSTVSALNLGWLTLTLSIMPEIIAVGCGALLVIAGFFKGRSKRDKVREQDRHSNIQE